MNKFAIIFFVFLILIILSVILTIGTKNIEFLMSFPPHTFKHDIRSKIPDYSNNKYWARLPNMNKDIAIEGINADTFLQKIDVFFIHSTAYFKPIHWNSILDENSATAENVEWFMMNNASIFNDANLYAPKYREASFFAFFVKNSEDGESAKELAYQDIVKAFDYFIKNYNNKKPFILVGQGQGSLHGLNLLKNKIEGTELESRMIVAYLLRNITEKMLENIKTPICNSPTDINCINSWSTFSEHYSPSSDELTNKYVCVNPLTWIKDGGRSEKELHLGFVQPSGLLYIEAFEKDIAKHYHNEPLKAPIKQHTYAECKNGLLLVEDQKNFVTNIIDEKNYYYFDYNLFYMNIKKNVSERTRAYFEKNKDLL